MFIIPAAATSCAASLAASCACWSAGALGRTIASRSARLAYVLFFSASLLLAWVLRLGAEPLVKHLPCELVESFCALSLSLSPSLLRFSLLKTASRGACCCVVWDRERERKREERETHHE